MPDLAAIATAEEAANLLRAGDISAVELAEHCLARVAVLDGRLRAFVTVTAERALDDARRADAVLAAARAGTGDAAPLAGVPIALKDLIATRGIRTTASSRVLDDWVPDADAPIAHRLAEAGTVLLGKTNTHEFAYGTYTPPTRNPWDLARVPGGSSGGSAAAVAAGLCLGATGTDTGGSIRIPAACCGVTGFKPTYGLVSTDGIIPLSWSLDHAGPIAHSVRDCALLLDALTGGELFEPLRPLPNSTDGDPLAPIAYRDATEDAAASVAGLRLGVPANYFFAWIDPAVETMVRAALRVFAALGATIEEVPVPAAIDDLFAVYRAVQRPEAVTAHQDAGWYPAHAEQYTPATRAALERGLSYTAGNYVRARRAKEAFTRELETLLTERVDALLTPTLPLVAPLASDTDRPLSIAGRADDAGLLRLTFPFDISGQPALTVPCGFSSAGLPIGLQIVTRQWDDATALRLGHAYQRATDWHLRRPPLV